MMLQNLLKTSFLLCLLSEVPASQTRNSAGELLDAAKVGDTGAVKKLLDSGVDVNASDSDGLTALHWASRKGKSAVSEILLNRRADVNAKDKSSETPLFNAAFYQHADMVKLLIKRGAAIDPVDKYGLTPLFMAVLGDTEDIGTPEIAGS